MIILYHLPILMVLMLGYFIYNKFRILLVYIDGRQVYTQLLANYKCLFI